MNVKIFARVLKSTAAIIANTRFMMRQQSLSETINRTGDNDDSD